METISDKLDHSRQMGLVGMGTNASSSQHPFVSNMDSGSTTPGIYSHVSQQMSANIQARNLEPMPGNLEPQAQLIPNQYSMHAEQQNNDPMWHSFLGPSYSSGMAGPMLSNLGKHHPPGKRKSPSESLSDASAVQKLSTPNKRMAHTEHRPWLQQLSIPNNGSLQMQSTSASPRGQYLPTPGKKMMHSDPISSRSGKQSSTRKNPIQGQPSPKVQGDSSESVRSKMRESLASALALVHNRDESPKGGKDSQSQNASSPGKGCENLQPVGSASAASGADASSEGAAVVPVPFAEGSVQNVQTMTQSHSHSVSASEARQESQFSNVFPQEDVPFSDNIFVKDELLQGNGLAWVLEPVTELGEKAVTEIAGLSKPDDEKVGRDVDHFVQDPQLLAFKIELELYKLFGGVNKKYKEKGRSLLFNLKDRNNPELRERVMSGDIPPEKLCSMTAEELASKELSQWRQAKAEEMAQMVVLPDTEVDIRRLVKKTHKGEFQVEVEPVDSGMMEVSSGVSSFSRPRSKVKKTKSSSPTKELGEKDEAKDPTKNTKGKDQDSSMHITIPPGESTDIMQGLTVDDEMKDANFLPPIVSLDEFMESLNSEPPFENLPTDAGRQTPVPGNSETELGSYLRSPHQIAQDRRDTAEKREKLDASLSKREADSESSPAAAKSDSKLSVATVKGEHVWEGLLQFSISSVTSVIGVFKSGEKTSMSEWPALLEVKGRVRLEAFQKFLQELPMSRSRAVMVVHLVSKQGLSKSEHDSLSETAESYVSDGRVGFAEPASAVELYLCPPHPKTVDILTKVIPKDQQDAFKSIDNGLIGVIVWRRPQLASSTALSPNSRHKHSSTRPHSSFRREHEKNTMVANVNFASPRSNNAPPHVAASVHNTIDDDDDDIPPGFGPGPAKDDDDLPEFNFSAGGQPSSQAPPQSRSVDKVRELILKYGKPSEGIRTWKANDDDDDDDIPEWQPQAPTHHVAPSAQPVHNYNSSMVNHGGMITRTNPPVQPQQTAAQQGGWWGHKPGGGRYYGSAEPRGRGF